MKGWHYFLVAGCMVIAVASFIYNDVARTRLIEKNNELVRQHLQALDSFTAKYGYLIDTTQDESLLGMSTLEIQNKYPEGEKYFSRLWIYDQYEKDGKYYLNAKVMGPNASILLEMNSTETVDVQEEMYAVFTITEHLSAKEWVGTLEGY